MPVEDGVIVFGSGEADLAENLPEDLIPASSALLESIEHFLDSCGNQNLHIIPGSVDIQ